MSFLDAHGEIVADSTMVWVRCPIKRCRALRLVLWHPDGRHARLYCHNGHRSGVRMVFERASRLLENLEWYDIALTLIIQEEMRV